VKENRVLVAALGPLAVLGLDPEADAAPLELAALVGQVGRLVGVEVVSQRFAVLLRIAGAPGPAGVVAAAAPLDIEGHEISGVVANLDEPFLLDLVVPWVGEGRALARAGRSENDGRAGRDRSWIGRAFPACGGTAVVAVGRGQSIDTTAGGSRSTAVVAAGGRPAAADGVGAAVTRTQPGAAPIAAGMTRSLDLGGQELKLRDRIILNLLLAGRILGG
jgi:hypothetical protein